ncbi:MAG TPA: hypothetical protein VMA36_11560 [Candidatus Limnocylindria bacterium]|jgi:hypothetical protein|nr:hypothetical protein [Candidatus Limnocylindria bacterium]
MQNRTDTTTPRADVRDQRVPTERAESPKRAQQQQQRVDLLPRDVLADFRTRWESVQTGFVDEPRAAVQNAHDLVDQLVDRLAQSFRRERDGLEGTWSAGADVSTEDLRIALQRYRSFFDRLLST